MSERQTVTALTPHEQRFYHVGAAANAAVKHERHVAVDAVRNAGQHGDGRRRPVQHAATMIRNLHRRRTGFDRGHRIFRA
jgi:hypothetical protein